MPKPPMLATLSDREVLVFAESMTSRPDSPREQLCDMIEELSARLVRRGGRDQTLGGTRREYTAPMVLRSDVRG